MKLTLRTKLTLATAVLVLGVVGLISVLYLANLTQHVIRQARDRASFVAEEVFLQAQQALNDAATHGGGPLSTSAADLGLYVKQTLNTNPGWNTAVRAVLGYSPSIYEVTVSDREGIALFSSDVSLPGHHVYQRPDANSLVHAGFLSQIRVLYGPPRVYEVRLPFNMGGQPFGDIRVALSTALLRDEISPELENAGWFALLAVVVSTLVAGALSRAALSPLQTISAQLDRISAGETDIEPVGLKDEFGQVSTKISRIGRELRDVREVFSTLRQNLDQVMSQLEDGLLLFNADGRIVLASPSACQFLGIKGEELTGHSLEELFPEGHPVREALRQAGAEKEEDAETEVTLQGPEGRRRAGIRAQPVVEGESRMGMLVTLRDLESREKIGNELQISENLAAIGRVTAGVAHEVKNPLNSMRVWLEVLRSNLPVEAESQQAAKMLDSEIERLDRVVKTFLDFTRPMTLDIEELDLRELLEDALLSARPSIETNGVEAKLAAEASVPPVRADRQLLRQAILNLVHNACEAMPTGGTLRLELTRRGEGAEIRVSDTGRGIAPEHRNRIFQLYFTTRPGGTGVGLANTFRFVQLHGGSIEFDSEAGCGTTFIVRLPLARAANSTAEPDGETATRVL